MLGDRVRRIHRSLGPLGAPDTSIRSISTAADALGKMATMLGVPPQALWGRIPGVTDDDVAEWKQMLPQTPEIEEPPVISTVAA